MPIYIYIEAIVKIILKNFIIVVQSLTLSPVNSTFPMPYEYISSEEVYLAFKIILVNK